MQSAFSELKLELNRNHYAFSKVMEKLKYVMDTILNKNMCYDFFSNFLGLFRPYGRNL